MVWRRPFTSPVDNILLISTHSVQVFVLVTVAVAQRWHVGNDATAMALINGMVVCMLGLVMGFVIWSADNLYVQTRIAHIVNMLLRTSLQCIYLLMYPMSPIHPYIPISCICSYIPVHPFPPIDSYLYLPICPCLPYIGISPRLCIPNLSVSVSSYSSMSTLSLSSCPSLFLCLLMSPCLPNYLSPKYSYLSPYPCLS